MKRIEDFGIDSEDFYSMFDTGLHYYLVERTGVLDEIQADVYRAVYGNRIFVACTQELDFPGLTPVESPEEVVETPLTEEEIIEQATQLPDDLLER